jgi:F0F1-type ATP synthase membrane subunit c/vacuolar-type H+-ATPase subunit K
MKNSTMIALGLAFIAATILVAFAGCAGVSGVLRTPYGDIQTDNGKTVVAPKPIIIPEK